MNDVRQALTARLQMVEDRLRAACRRAGRSRDEVTLVAVTKTVSAEVASLLPEIGVVYLGENRPQELWRKAPLVPGGVHWHLIGHLQRNKIERTLPLVRLIHSVDSVRLLEALDQAAAGRPEPLAVLLEVNASREPNKHGFAPEEVLPLAEMLAGLRHVRVEGLMTMAAYDADPERARATFAEARKLRDRLGLRQLSMGMSHDFEVAIEEGATLVRIGSALFEGLAAG